MILHTSFGDFDTDLLRVICQFADSHNLPPPAILAMGLQESSLNPAAVGDNGQSYGTFQVYLPAHGGTPDRWTGITGTQNAMAEMAARWSDTFQQCGGWTAWLSNPVSFQQVWTPQAQGSIPWTADTAGLRVGQSIVVYALYLKSLAAVLP